MGRWMPEAGERLERAAFELFAENGFAETTVPQITARAGLTTRTFFRYFTDKREVLFSFDEQLPHIIAEVMAEAPPEMTPLAVIGHSLDVIATNQLAGQQHYLRAHRAIVESDDGLRERALRKQAIMIKAVETGFHDRGLDELTARLSAHLAVTVFSVAVERWLDLNDDLPLTEILHDTLGRLATLATEPTTVREVRFL
ncbi:TetR family transcriptional regulator [Subtercola sp. PAMC28395]|uniref:TetR family transcriptional regulator n=1 Tax=Subtercola sp. PAMC28395 TaxID=2846775 RepID=UPI001C0C9C98|nr:TetR family transcriptional regulator [Subtercola sp. PAMC28395]QWT24082.1 TetR family transcriptional regulator [Subtercola sp. PAMC28395]